MQNQVGVGFSSTTIEHISFGMLMNPFKVRLITVVKNFHLCIPSGAIQLALRYHAHMLGCPAYSTARLFETDVADA